MPSSASSRTHHIIYIYIYIYVHVTFNVFLGFDFRQKRVLQGRRSGYVSLYLLVACVCVWGGGGGGGVVCHYLCLFHYFILLDPHLLGLKNMPGAYERLAFRYRSRIVFFSSQLSFSGVLVSSDPPVFSGKLVKRQSKEQGVLKVDKTWRVLTVSLRLNRASTSHA
jgi:hypothetical protein